MMHCHVQIQLGASHTPLQRRAVSFSQTSLGHHLGHSHGNFRSDLHVQCAATRSFVHDNTQMLHVLYVMGAIHLPSP